MKSMSRTVLSATKMLLAMGVVIIVLVLGGCDKSSEEVSHTKGTTSGGDIEVSITIECEENLFFSRYDLDVYVDDGLQGSLDHGATKEFALGLDEGNHTLCIAERGDSSVDGSVDFSVEGSTSLKYRAKCTNQQVEIEQINSLNPPISADEVPSMYHDEIHRAFEDAGFTNISEVEVRDLAIDQRGSNWHAGAVSINGSDAFTAEDLFFADDEIVITYHVLADLNAPASSSSLEGRNYQEVVSLFEDAGFINVTTTTTGASGAAGTVSEVRIGGIFGDSDFSTSDTFAFDAGVEITYYEGESAQNDSSDAESVPEADLNRLLNQNSMDASWFSSAYKGRTITFDGWVADVQHHENYDTRWDVLILKGNSGDASSDLSFRLTDVSLFDMNTDNDEMPWEGDNITITAVVGDYNATSGWLELDPVSISFR